MRRRTTILDGPFEGNTSLDVTSTEEFPPFFLVVPVHHQEFPCLRNFPFFYGKQFPSRHLSPLISIKTRDKSIQFPKTSKKKLRSNRGNRLRTQDFFFKDQNWNLHNKRCTKRSSLKSGQTLETSGQPKKVTPIPVKSSLSVIVLRKRLFSYSVV